MGRYFSHFPILSGKGPPPPGYQVSYSFKPLMLLGLNLPVEISTASLYRGPPANMPLSSIVVMAHFDTGASITSIDINLAIHLNLVSTGQSTNHTASGPQEMPNFAIDLSFPNTKLMPFQNLHISSCRLDFDLKKNANNKNLPQNFGMLIGRDIMSTWNIIWDGPTSTVIIND